MSAVSVIFGLIIFFYLIPTQVVDPSPTIPNSKTFPYLLTGAFILLSCKWVFNAVIKSSKQTTHSPRSLFVGLGIGMVFLFIGYLLGTLGYIIGGVIATSSVIMAIEGERRWLMALIAGVAITVLFSMIFGKLLQIELPAGVLSFF
jgi:hypothetical protein